MPSWERRLSSPEQSLKCEDRQLKLWLRGAVEDERNNMLLHHATEASLMTPFRTDWRLLMGLPREHGKRRNSYQCRRLFSVFCLFWQIQGKDPFWKGPGEVLHLSVWIHLTFFFYCDESVSQEDIIWSQGSIICGRNRKRETLKMDCHCTEVETVFFSRAIVSSRNNWVLRETRNQCSYTINYFCKVQSLNINCIFHAGNAHIFYRHRMSSTKIHCGEQVASCHSRKVRSKGPTVPIKQTMELARRKLSGLLASGCEKTHIVNYFRAWNYRIYAIKTSPLLYHTTVYPTKLFFLCLFRLTPHTRLISQEARTTKS